MESLVGLAIFVFFIIGLYLTLTKDRRRDNIYKRRFEEEHKNWLRDEEWKQQQTNDYPHDWKHRRLEAYRKADRKCSSCGTEIGSGDDFGADYLRGVHIHHKKPLSQGGDNSLQNLQLLCEECHSTKHPNRSKLIRGLTHQHLRRRKVRRQAKQKT
jgi:5-methylcytosine-specific restriction endonuclease McrA